MSDFIKPSELLAQFDLPKQDLAKLSFCGSSKEVDVRKWLDGMHATQIMQTSAQLYYALPEVLRLKTDYNNLSAMLETLRPSVQNAIATLAKHFLHQPLILPKEAKKTAIVAQALQKNMIDGYCSVICQITEKGKANQQTLDLLALTIHRAITGIGLLFLRSYQMYSQPPKQLWQRLYSLYLTAQYFDINESLIKDPMLNFGIAQNINSAFMRVLMLSTAKCNQLNQNDVAAVYNALEDWCSRVKLAKPNDTDENFFSVDLLADQAPIYKSKLISDNFNYVRELDFTALLKRIDIHTGDSDEIMTGSSDIKIPKEFPKSLFEHLSNCWKVISQRQLERRQVEGAADVCIGLVDCHYYLCNGQEFRYFVKNSGKEELEHNISRFTPRGMQEEANNSSYDRPIFRISLQNASSGGYCMMWKGNIPPKVEAGELIGIKELGRRTWSIGVVRWIKQLKQASQLGIQLLSTSPKPYGVAQVFDMGGYADYSRAIYIPSSRFSSSSASILTPGVPFQEFDKVKILDGDQEWSAKLERNIFASGNIRQFSFRALSEEGGEDETAATSDQNFESDWE